MYSVGVLELENLVGLVIRSDGERESGLMSCTGCYWSWREDVKGCGYSVGFLSFEERFFFKGKDGQRIAL